MSEHEDPAGYDGDVTVVVDGEQPRRVHAVLAARFDPLVGRVVWTGRVSTALPPRASIVIETPHGVESAEEVEPDPWGNTRVRGSGRPPFPIELLDGGHPSGTGA